MKKKIYPIAKIVKNLKQLIPYIGTLFVIAGTLGLLLVQNPLETTQDIRSQASETTKANYPEITEKLITPFIVDQAGEVDLIINSANYPVKKITLIFNLVNTDIDTPVVVVNAVSGFRAEELNIEQVSDGYLVKVIAVPTNLNLTTPVNNKSFLKIAALSHKAGNLLINFDQDNSYISTPTTDVLIKVPQNPNYKISNSSEEQLSENNVVGCNEICSNNADCKVGMRCYTTEDTQRCRLATNPSSQSCSTSSSDNNQTQSIIRQCNEYCESNNECTTGLTCYKHFCRNPKNPQDNRCANPTTKQTKAITQNCGESCSTNADCAINLRCYQNECRLATNPSSTTCSAVTEKTISVVYNNKATKESDPQEIKKSDTPLKGSNMIPNTDKNKEYSTPKPTIEPKRKEYDNTYEADETLLDLIKNIAKNNSSKLPFLVILLGIILLISSIIMALIANLKKTKKSHIAVKNLKENKKIHITTHPVQSRTQPETKPFSHPVINTTHKSSPSKNPLTEDLLKKLKEEQKNQPKT